ncbi:uncharacterized protein LOC121737420 [Aricia agestis]|uniref:uncharacterized protein LOC121737420 n=1 Tax=Aricia agestis TaxID=91739 RepID=UPI001C20A102|nr:uncharacterized protein LOC121737420 [Aricia agestis]
MGVIRSMCMYGAPIWAERLTTKTRRILTGLQRTMAIRAIRGYRTISKNAACVLAGSIPWDIEAESLAEKFWLCQEEREEGRIPPPDQIRRWRRAARDRDLDLWLDRLNESPVSVDLLGAIRPALREWVDRDSGALTYRLTQVLTGHGCFGQYLCDMARREQNTACHHCNDDRDTAQHTLLVCPAWSSQRATLQATIGPNITLPAIVRAMLDSQHFWRAVETFAYR